MSLYSLDLKVCATVYIRAKTKKEPLEIAKELSNTDLDDVGVSGLSYEDPNLPDVSLSPAMTILGPWNDSVELVA